MNQHDVLRMSASSADFRSNGFTMHIRYWTTILAVILG